MVRLTRSLDSTEPPRRQYFRKLRVKTQGPTCHLDGSHHTFLVDRILKIPLQQAREMTPSGDMLQELPIYIKELGPNASFPVMLYGAKSAVDCR
jgi:hypothetical protein